MAPRKRKLTPDEQRKRFIDLARQIGADESEEGEERAFGKVGLKKATQPKKKRGLKAKT